MYIAGMLSNAYEECMLKALPHPVTIVGADAIADMV